MLEVGVRNNLAVIFETFVVFMCFFQSISSASDWVNALRSTTTDLYYAALQQGVVDSEAGLEPQKGMRPQTSPSY